MGDIGGVISCWLCTIHDPDDSSGSVLCVRYESMDAVVDVAGDRVALEFLPLERKPSFPKIGLFGVFFVGNEKVEARECIDSDANSVDIKF